MLATGGGPAAQAPGVRPLMSLVHLDEFNGLALIVSAPTGVEYTNQAGGMACLHPTLEGAFVPLPVKLGRPEIYAITQHFRGGWQPLVDRDADILDGILRRHDLGFISVDRAHLNESYEAWVHVIIDPSRAKGLIERSHWRAGVLTWQNSD